MSTWLIGGEWRGSWIVRRRLQFGLVCGPTRRCREMAEIAARDEIQLMGQKERILAPLWPWRPARPDGSLALKELRFGVGMRGGASKLMGHFRQVFLNSRSNGGEGMFKLAMEEGLDLKEKPFVDGCGVTRSKHFSDDHEARGGDSPCDVRHGGAGICSPEEVVYSGKRSGSAAVWTCVAWRG